MFTLCERISCVCYESCLCGASVLIIHTCSTRGLVSLLFVQSLFNFYTCLQYICLQLHSSNIYISTAYLYIHRSIMYIH